MKAYKRERYATDPVLRGRILAKAKEQKRSQDPAMIAYQIAYRTANRERLRLMAINYRQQNAQTIKEKAKIRSATPERRAWARLYRKHRMDSDPEFRERLRRYDIKGRKRYYQKHRASILERLKREYWADPDVRRAATRKSLAIWRAKHPDTMAAVQARRKAVRRGAVAEGFDDTAHYKLMQKWQQNRCYHCDEPLLRFHRDHLVPLTRDDGVVGTHSAGNLVLACGRCNGSKHAKLLWREWTPPLGYASPLLLEEQVAVVVSTFSASERGRQDASDVVAALRRTEPVRPIFFDWEWFNRRIAVENMLSARSGAARVTSARSTKVAVLDTEDARSFLEMYHLQGFGRGTVYLGLLQDDDLVAVSSWLAIGGAIELNRMAFKGRVQGGFGRLLSTFRREFLPAATPLLSFVDLRYADGHSYSQFGFELAGETAQPVYYYVGPGGIFHRRLFTRDAMQKRLNFFDAALPERENARINGYYRVFGLKQKRFILRPSE